MSPEESYTAKDIQVMEGLEAVRKRPAMYIGDISKRGFHHLIFEVVDNSVDEALAGYCTDIDVAIHKDGSISIADNGRGIPVEMHATGKSALEVVVTVLHAGGKFDKKAYKVSGGLHGVGVSVVNALSERMDVEVHRDGKIYMQSYSRGKPLGDVKQVGETAKRGTTVRFKPDEKIFGDVQFDYDYLRERLMELAFLNAGLKISIADEREGGKSEKFHYEGGLKQFVEHLDKARTKLHAPFFYAKKMDGTEIEYALQYTDSYNETLYSFVNDINTIEGGTHVTGFKTALTRAVNEFFKEANYLKGEQRISGSDVLEGITVVLSLKVQEPQFEGQTKTKLGNSEVKGFVDSMVYESFKTYLEEHPGDARTIADKVMRSMQAREAAQKAKDLIRRKGVFESSILPGKLADCTDSDPIKAEIYLVEGDSAGGSSRQARDRKHQAILPLRGKILNIEKAPLHRALANEEIKSIALAIGSGFRDELDISKVRYHKIVIMTDADVDGSHIRTLLLTLFYRYFRPIIDRGYLYIAQPPLYKLKKGKEIVYAYSDEELNSLLKKGLEGAEIQRYKGLGEMNPEQLWETTMDPATRTLKQVTIKDAMVADELFTILMGTEVGPRREFIEAHAAEVKNLDI
ncbi:DNA topoisomerase (ATP-hydrolyzing) subunit B [Candidatus Micrarchaeota archaeon]|nr:DNA topoisomerase (ATP-hydrolyzing) subunit B [Candidatus Micrarchaeota archaeon]